MSNVIDFSRFREPDYRDEPKVMAHCDCCSEELYEGDTVVKFDGEIFCSTGCFLDYMDITEEEL